MPVSVVPRSDVGNRRDNSTNEAPAVAARIPAIARHTMNTAAGTLPYHFQALVTCAGFDTQ